MYTNTFMHTVYTLLNLCILLCTQFYIHVCRVHINIHIHWVFSSTLLYIGSTLFQRQKWKLGHRHFKNKHWVCAKNATGRHRTDILSLKCNVQSILWFINEWPLDIAECFLIIFQFYTLSTHTGQVLLLDELGNLLITS